MLQRDPISYATLAGAAGFAMTPLALSRSISFNSNPSSLKAPSLCLPRSRARFAAYFRDAGTRIGLLIRASDKNHEEDEKAARRKKKEDSLSQLIDRESRRE
jgi:hypothetical protein